MGATRRTLLTRVGMILAATALALPAAAGTASASPGVPGAASVCQQLSDQLTGLLDRISDLSTEIEGTPAGPSLTTLLGQISALQEQADSISEQLGELVCSAIPSGSGGTGSSSRSHSASYDHGHDHHPVVYGSAHRYYDDYDINAPVVATQVDAVPRGGVATGDGSFGE